MDMNAKVSVIIPFYNRLDLLFEAIESVLDQTYKNWELILIDDGSTDDIHELLEFIKRDQRIIYKRQDHKGVSSARNLGIKIASGDYIAFLDSDDLFLPEKLELQLRYMMENEYDVSHTSYELIDRRTNEIIQTVHSAKFCGDVFPAIIQECPICPSTFMIKRSLLHKLDEPFNPRFSIGEDVCFFIDIAYRYIIGGIDTVLTRMRRDECSAAVNLEKQRQGLLNIISHIMSREEYYLHEKELANLVAGFNSMFISNGERVGFWNSEQINIEEKRLSLYRYFMERKYFPKVSIIIPVYNGANYLRDAIESAINQTYPNTEIIVVNDGSTDNGETERIALSYGKRIRYFYKENGGVASALNYGIEKMEGEFFSWLSHDDAYHPEKIATEVEEACKYKDPSKVFFCGYTTIDSEGKILQDYHLPKYVTENIDCLLALDTDYTLNGCTLLIHKSMFEKYGKFDTTRRFTQDYDLWLKFSKSAEFVYIDKCLVYSRQHQEQDTRKKNNIVTLEADKFHFMAISQLSPISAAKYLNGRMNKIFYQFQNYKANNYIYTSLAIIKLIFLLYAREGMHSEGIKQIGKLLNVKLYNTSRIPDDQIAVKTKPKTIMIYSNAWTFGGIERVMTILSNYLCDKYNIILLSESSPNEAGYELPENVVHLKMVRESDCQIPFCISAIANMLDIDLFIGNPNIIQEFLPVYKLLHGLNIKSIAANHYYYFLPYQIEWIRPIARLRHEAFRYANVVTWSTTFGARLCAAYNPNVAVAVMPNPNTYSPSDVSEENHREKVVLAVGRFYDAIKRVDKMLRVFKEIYIRDPSVRFILVGGYDMDMVVPDTCKTVGSLLKELDFPDGTVTFTGEQSDVKPYYEKASVLILTSECEGFGMVLTEAGTFGLPVVMFEIPGTEEIIIDNENGFIVPQNDYDQMADRILQLMHDAELWKQMSSRARGLATRFSQDIICRRWEKLIDLVFACDMERDCIKQQLIQEGLFPGDGIDMALMTRVVKEYEKYLNKYATAAANVSSQIIYQPIPQTDDAANNIYMQEIIKMQQSLSWRVTKPLRLVRKVMVTVKQFGLLFTIRKILKKIKNEIVKK